MQKTKITYLLFLVLFGTLLFLVIMEGCNKRKKKNRGLLPDSSIYQSQNYNDLLLDSASITAFLKTFSVSDTIKEEINEFYARRNYQLAWINNNGLSHSVSTFYNQLQNYQKDFADNSLDNRQMEELILAFQADEKGFLAQKSQVQQLELLLTSTFFRFAEKAYGGINKSPYDLEWFIPRKKKNYQVLLDSLVSLAKGETVQEPVNQYYLRLKDKLKQYRVIQKNGGWKSVVTSKKKIAVGDSDSCVVNIKEHLFLTGDLRANDKTTLYTDSLAYAVKRFQRRMGLPITAKADLATIKELNQSIDVRIRQIMINMERLRWVPVEIESDNLLINIPEYKLHVIEKGKQVWEMNVVVGKTASQTSIFKGNLSQIVLNPYWGVPTSIVRNEILPKLKQNTSYLSRNHIEVLSGNKVVNPNSINWRNYEGNVPFNFRQLPGDDNALGKIKFLFPNNFNIYLHDTPSKGLFNEPKRAFSHGCIRVSQPNRLALYLLRNDKAWNKERVDKILKTNKEYGIKVSPMVPVYIVYFTSWVDNTGQINFRKDLYGLDAKLSKEIFGDS